MHKLILKSREKIDGEMAELLKKLLKIKKVAIITGGAFTDIDKQVLSGMGLTNELNKNLILLPTNGGSLWVFDNGWDELFSSSLSQEEKNKIIDAIKLVENNNKDILGETSFGERIQDRGSQITYSALGDKAPYDLKKAWDSEFKKRIILQNELEKLLPDFEVKIGGSTSIDITQKGMDKAYAIQKLMDYLKLEKQDILFLGDAIYENGNDYPVFLMGVDTIKVISPDETKERLIRLLKNPLT